MLGYTLTFIVVAIIAGILGFSGLAASAAWIAKLFFFGFLVVAVLSLALGRRAPVA